MSKFSNVLKNLFSTIFTDSTGSSKSIPVIENDGSPIGNISSDELMKTLHDTYYLSYTTQVLEPEAEEMTSIKCKGCYIVGFGDMKQLEIVLGGSTTGMHIIVA